MKARHLWAVAIRICLLTTAGVLVGSVLAATPASAKPASSSTDLTVALTNKVDALPGRRVTYLIVVHNKGPVAASRVQVTLTTSAKLTSIKYKTGGRCYRRAHKTACLFGRIRAGKTATATISGVMPKLKKGTLVTNRVTLASGTHLINRADDTATDNYRLGVPRMASVVPASVPAGSSKLATITSAASRVLGYSGTAVLITYLALGGALAWFALGLSLHRRARTRRITAGSD